MRNRRAKQVAAERGETATDEPEMFNGFNSIQVGTIRRMRGEAELLDERAKEAVERVAGLKINRLVDEAREVVEEEQKGITAKVNTARERRDRAVVEEENVERCKRLIEGYKRESNQSRARQIELTRLADRLDSEAAEVEVTSRSQGPQRVLSQLERRHHQQTHKAQKKGREAMKKAARIRQHLDAAYPGHGQVP
jgi:hypothetical protein